MPVVAFQLCVFHILDDFRPVDFVVASIEIKCKMKLNVRGGREIIWLIFAGLVLYVMIATGEKFKLAYFNARGEAEIIRLIFAVVGVVYEDARITQKIWEEIKSGTNIIVIL